MTSFKEMSSANFGFLKGYDAQLVRHAALAERYFQDDPNTCLIKLRQFCELLAQLTAANMGLYIPEESQNDLLKRLKAERVLSPQVADWFHYIRRTGNQATHEGVGSHSDALTALKVARGIGVWFHRTFGPDKQYSPGPFVPPPNPAAASQSLQEELASLRQALADSQSETEKARLEAEAHAQALMSAEERARKEAEERANWEQVASEAEQLKATLEEQLKTIQASAAAAPAKQTNTLIQSAQEAATGLDLDEAATRAIIDEKLMDRGWEADTQNLKFSQGTRPVRGKNMAIAEWPTDKGPADYALFIGTQCVGVIEAKRRRRNVSGAIDQAERYAKGFAFTDGAEATGGPWDEYKIPFLFATNGRPYLKQVETESGIWFRDARKATNHRRALVDWPTPDGLKAQLEMDRDKAHEALKALPYEFGFPLRKYQKKAIEKVEEALEQDQRQMLIAMATGTGKTKLAIAMLYRLLHTKRFRRVCFVVDRSALGNQAEGEFKTTKVVSVRTFADTFGLKGLDDVHPDTDTKIHICTIQGLVKRVLYANEPADVPPIDQYDLIVIDECHRGYLLDREMSDAELEFRSQDDYISKYRRVLEHFDATKIGLTATPALHTKEIFADPIYTYSYREAVVDGYLIDHEPPIQIWTQLSQAGITFEAGDSVELLNTATGEVNSADLDDELHFDVEHFNRKVITPTFNEALANALAEYIDPGLPGKTLVFAVNKGHADILVDKIKKAMEDRYGEIEDAAIKRITGDTDRVKELILSYRNDPMPKIAVTVDLLTTGIDVPSITNLVFVRRVNSRILYEQMLGRATRTCDEIDKETFRIFDAVNLYETLEPVTAMKPVVVNPSITFTQLFEELKRVQEDAYQEKILDEVIVKLRRRIKRMQAQVQEVYLAEAGEGAIETLQRFQDSSARGVAEWLQSKPKLGPILDWNPDKGKGTYLPISNHADEVVSITRGYGGDGQRPEDYLDGFISFIRNNVNEMAALSVVVQRPRELTRAQLRELKLELDRMGYSETALRKAWQDTKNEDIAASIIGFIRQAALGDPLIPYEDRVKVAMDCLLKARSWNEIQRKWLKRIGDQYIKEIIVDREALDSGQFKVDAGGFDRLNRVFGGNLETVLSDINEELWRTGS